MRTLFSLVLMIAVAIVIASATVEVYRSCGEGWWWKGPNWCAMDYVQARLSPPPEPAPEPAPAAKPKPKPKPRATS